VPDSKALDGRPGGFVRSIGRWSMTALVVNSIIGASIFGLPAELIRLVGSYSPLAMILAALIISIIVACMAEVAARFDEAGGGYLYVHTAFGRFAGLQVGWFWILASIGGGAACANLFLQYLESIFPAAGNTGIRALLMALLIAVPAAMNYVGVRSGANLSTTLTIAKLLPLALLIALGLIRFTHHNELTPATQFAQPGASAWLTALLLLTFAYAGFENALAPGGEMKDPQRTIPFALTIGLLVCAVVYGLLQFVAVTTIGSNPSAYPLADAATVLLGRSGSLFVSFAVMISTYGWISGDMLNSPRIVYAFAASGNAPSWLAKIHPRFHTPALAIVIYAALTWGLAVTGTFLWVAAVSGAATLVLYSGVCASLLRLRRLRPEPKTLRVPFPRLLSFAAIAISLTLISTLDRRQALLMLTTFLIATANWWWARRRSSDLTSANILPAGSGADF
jgi:basic amino acid/polyamine antiporter, APA family